MSVLSTRLLWSTLLLSSAGGTAAAVQANDAEAGLERIEADQSTTLTQDIDTSRWWCKLCIYPIGWYGTLDIGPGTVSDASNRFGDYRGLDEDGLFLSLDGDAHYRDDNGGYFDLYVRNLAIDSRQFDMRGGQRGRYELRLAYSEIPKYRGYGTQTPFHGVGTGNLTLPADWVRANQTTGMTSLAGALTATPLKTKRKTLEAGLTLKFPTKWSFRVDFEHQEKDGTRPYGGGFGLFASNATHIPAPVDFTTNQFDMALQYVGSRSSLSFGFQGSSFDNGTSSLTWDNPFLSDPGTESFRAALAPDNTFHQFNVSGAFAPTTKIRLSGNAALGRMKQDDPFLPYSINPEYSNWPLPRATLDGKVDTYTLNLAGKLTARLARRLDFTARVKLDERDNKTDVDEWTTVLTDSEPTPERPNRPYSFTRQKYDAELRWRAGSSLRLMGGIKQENIKRNLQSVGKTRNTTYWGEVLFSPWSVAQLRLKLEASDRDGSQYQQLDDGGPIENPLMRKFHLADRDRDRVIVELDIFPADRLGISISYFRAKDDYTESIIGLTKSKEHSLSVDLNYSITQNISIYAFANQEDIDSELTSLYSDSGLPWDGTTDDSITSLGLGFNGKINAKFSIGFDWVSSDAKGDILVEGGGGSAPFPTLKSDLRNARINLSYLANQHWGMKFYAEHEKYKSKDWAIDGLGADGIVDILTMGAVSPDYSVTVFRLLASYTF